MKKTYSVVITFLVCFALKTYASDLTKLEELLNTEVTSVSKVSERAFDAAAAIYVITKEDIRKSGLTTIPEILRLAPGVQVARAGSSDWAVSIRGFNSQFSNKLLVLIDGKSVYNPISLETYWDVQETLIEDIKQIEVIRGPGTTLWGSNAVNGVINIITEEAINAQGGYSNVIYGTDEKIISARYGGKINDDTEYRTYAKFTDRNNTEDLNGNSLLNDWNLAKGGFRVDTTSSNNDLISFSGDFHYGARNLIIAYPSLDSSLPTPFVNNVVDDEEMKGGSVLLNWDHIFDNGANAILKTYFDYQSRNLSYYKQDRFAYDMDLQYNLPKVGIHSVTLGLGYRHVFDDIENNNFLSYTPSQRTDNLYSAFFQDKMGLVDDTLYLTIGSKFEHNNYTGFEFQPSARISYMPNSDNTIWASISRAVRVPNRNMDDVNFIAGVSPDGFVRLIGNRNVESEELIAYEAGFRSKLSNKLSIDVSAYYNDYDLLASNDILSPNKITAGNANSGEAVGFEASAKLQVNDKWNMNFGYSYIDIDINQSNATFVTSADNTPQHQFNIISSLNLTDNVQVNNQLYYYDSILKGEIPSYFRLDSNIKWQVNDDFEISVAGQNLLDDQHQEFNSFIYTNDSNIGRSFYLGANYFF